MTDKQRARLTGRGTAGPGEAGAPTEEKLPDGQFADHWVLPEEERAKGYVRPLRRSYRHVGARPQHPTRELTVKEQQKHAGLGYAVYEEYPKDVVERTGVVGRFWKRSQLERGCGEVTSMPQGTAETIARDPGYYGSTFCVHCGDYFPIGERGEFVWVDDGTRMGT